jgi:biotin carboxyl carrier protein
MKIMVRAGGETRTMRVLRRGDRLRVQPEGGGEVELRLLASGDGGFELEHGHARIHGAGARNGRANQLWVNGRTLSYERVRARAAAREVPTDARAAAPIPAVVLDVLVGPGELVKAGQKLVLLESMKMVLPVTAGRDGRVVSVHCAAGESVEAGRVLVALAGDDDGA